MFTDPNRKKRSDPGDPHVCNVFAFLGMLNSAERHKQIETDCSTAKIGCVECKAELATKMLDWLRPIQERRKALLAEPGKLDALLARGNERARAVARATMKEVRKAVFKVS
jgi:tryptophanyl-tRNA synthetase